ERLRRNQLQSLLRLSSKPIGILKGTFEEKPDLLSVACGNNEHSILALQIGEAIATSEECSMELMKIFPKSESEQETEKTVKSSIHKSGLQLTPKIVLRQSNDVESGILKETEDSSLLLIGASS